MARTICSCCWISENFNCDAIDHCNCNVEYAQFMCDFTAKKKNLRNDVDVIFEKFANYR